jgi:hypothetical protein
MTQGTDVPAGDEQPWPSDWQRVETLGLADLVMTILRARRTAPWATAAVVSRQSHGGALLVRVRLLDGTPAPAAGEPGGGASEPDDGEVAATFAARRFCQDLTDAFGDKSVIILK